MYFFVTPEFQLQILMFTSICMVRTVSPHDQKTIKPKKEKQSVAIYDEQVFACVLYDESEAICYVWCGATKSSVATPFRGASAYG